MLDQNVLFSASTVHLEHITTALNCLTPFGLRDDVLIIIDSDGLSFARENNRVISIQLFLSKELFISYQYNAPESDSDAHTKISVKINHILDSISVASRDKDDVVECTLSYVGEGSPFVLIFEDSAITEKVEYSTYLTKEWDMTGLELDRSLVDLECMMKGDIFYSALQDLKEIGCKECYIYARAGSSGKNIFAIISKSHLGFSKILLPSERSILEKLETFDSDTHEKVHEKPVIGFFDFGSFDKMRASAKIASKVLIRKDAHGLMSVNILSETDDILRGDSKTKSSASPANPHSSAYLSREYPGIVIDISILEKARVDYDDMEEVKLLMQNNDELKAPPAYQPVSTGASRDPNPAAQESTSLLFNERKRHAEELDNGEDGEFIPATNDIPLFF
ncbi:Rad17p [Lachancea thermotolerans CBS 6340]|uniref:DNA damage checkpoint control protein RAD17 n=1 Tax=Lachancea thermotolerans (strain ATCC 56472 / CBS 6340 / NRRL Y-8284) TaxID=559295 RepID=C5DFX9_LACTC|nr:KLTH0D00814p [Lachancea thermotolerans CBS 6340]CAR22321.1 KLTH0D00814p [Lachancea thermotolerans CBS 6340]